MCGITGFVNKNIEFPEVIFRDVTASLEHRGPDDFGLWNKDNIGIGHTRLSILDLTDKGKQPMTAGNENYVISYNGELYNHKTLKKDLISRGHKFFSNSDTEVVLKSLIEWGPKALEKFNGMFALAFFDKEKKQLILARDRYGIKPLYFYKSNNFLLFGSEYKSFFHYPEFKKSFSIRTMKEYLSFQNILSSNTFLEGINLLEPGSYAIYSLQNKNLKITKYWDFNFSSEHKINHNDAKAELKFLFKRAVESQLMSDVEIGSYLSGGIDSGSITSIASQKIDNLKSFTCGFDLTSASGIELVFDERKNAELMSSIFKTEHYEIFIKSGDMERCIHDLVFHLEDPRVGQSYPNFYASKLASKFVKVVLSGAGGDELFAGYPWRYFNQKLLKKNSDFFESYFSYWQRMLSINEFKKLLQPISEADDAIYLRDVFFKNIKNSDENQSYESLINSSLYFEAKTFLHGLLIVEDKLSMAHGLETRVPFLDNDLVDFAMRCPLSLKLKKEDLNLKVNENSIDKYKKNNTQGKLILRKSLSDLVPKKFPQQGNKDFQLRMRVGLKEKVSIS